MINSQLFKLALTLPYRLATYCGLTVFLLRSYAISIVILVHFYCGLSIVLYCCPFGLRLPYLPGLLEWHTGGLDFRPLLR